MTAAEVLRERAARADEYAMKSSRYAGEEYCVVKYQQEARELRALADLVERCILKDVCLICDRRLDDAQYPWGGRHADDCPLAAVERAFQEQGNG